MGKGHRESVQKQGITFNKDLGQHILKNPLVITSMIEKVTLVSLVVFGGCFFNLICSPFSPLFTLFARLI